MDPHDVAVVGAGAMGHGLAIQCVRHGLDVTLIDHRQANLDAALARIEDTVGARIDDWPADADDRLKKKGGWVGGRCDFLKHRPNGRLRSFVWQTP